MGTFRTTVGPMNSGKTAYFIVEYNNLKLSDLKVLVIKSKLDTRDGIAITSRILKGQIVYADYFIDENEDIPVKEILSENYDVVMVDEMQMLTPLQIRQLHYLTVVSDIHVYLYGLKICCNGLPFESSALALSLADDTVELKTINKQKQSKEYAIKYNDLMPVDISKVNQIEAGGDTMYKSVSREEYFTVYKQYLEKELNINSQNTPKLTRHNSELDDEVEWVLGLEVSSEDITSRKNTLEAIFKKDSNMEHNTNLRYFQRDKVESNQHVIQINRMAMFVKDIDGEPNVFVSSRIGESTEKRLLNKLTCLFGGHTNLIDNRKTLHDTLDACINRELIEELDVDLSKLNHYNVPVPIYTPNVEDSKNVSNFHACDLVICYVDAESEPVIKETNKLSKGYFAPIADFIHNHDTLETWSYEAVKLYSECKIGKSLYESMENSKEVS